MKVGSIEYAESFLEYFEGHSEHEALFIPEATVAKDVVALMRTQPLTREAIKAVWRLMVDIDRIAHYNGTGWYGFRGAVQAWLSLKGHRALPAPDTPPGWSTPHERDRHRLGAHALTRDTAGGVGGVVEEGKCRWLDGEFC